MSRGDPTLSYEPAGLVPGEVCVLLSPLTGPFPFVGECAPPEPTNTPLLAESRGVAVLEA